MSRTATVFARSFAILLIALGILCAALTVYDTNASPTDAGSGLYATPVVETEPTATPDDSEIIQTIIDILTDLLAGVEPTPTPDPVEEIPDSIISIIIALLIEILTGLGLEP